MQGVMETEALLGLFNGPKHAVGQRLLLPVYEGEETYPACMEHDAVRYSKVPDVSEEECSPPDSVPTLDGGAKAAVGV